MAARDRDDVVTVWSRPVSHGSAITDGGSGSAC